MKKCSKCGKELSDNVKFCSGCGGEYKEEIMETANSIKEKFCYKCGARIKEEAKFCPSCGSEQEKYENDTLRAKKSEELLDAVNDKVSKAGKQITEGMGKGKEKFNQFQNMLSEEKNKKINEYAEQARAKGNEFISDVKNYKSLPKRRKRNIAVLLGIIAFVILILFIPGTNSGSTSSRSKGSSIMKVNGDHLDGAVYNYNLEGAISHINIVLQKYFNTDQISLERNFELIPDEIDGKITYNYVSETDLGFPLSIEIIVDKETEKLAAISIKTRMSALNGLGDVQKIYVNIVNQMFDDSLAIEKVKEIVKAGYVDCTYYKNNNSYIFAKSYKGEILYYGIGACTDDVAEMKGYIEAD